MEKNLSSAAFHQVRPTVPEELGDIPTGYGTTESYLLPKDPAWLFLFWEITQETFAEGQGTGGNPGTADAAIQEGIGVGFLFLTVQ
ncbi:MAG: hypothetical protein IKB61_00445, partial [Elusimicrobiaceae bacterium]|nr:hypothetical protein [Elusimicrobiaceae bacterium]